MGVLVGGVTPECISGGAEARGGARQQVLLGTGAQMAPSGGGSRSRMRGLRRGCHPGIRGLAAGQAGSCDWRASRGEGRGTYLTMLHPSRGSSLRETHLSEGEAPCRLALRPASTLGSEKQPLAASGLCCALGPGHPALGRRSAGKEEGRAAVLPAPPPAYGHLWVPVALLRGSVRGSGHGCSGALCPGAPAAPPRRPEGTLPGRSQGARLRLRSEPPGIPAGGSGL